MIYGRRFFEKNQPQQNQRGLWKESAKIFQNRKAPYRSFQFKYALLLVGTGILSTLLFLGPAWYFTQQNFAIFQKLAFDTDPQLIKYLDREVVWLGFFFAFGLLVSIVFNLYSSLRLTRTVMEPIHLLERHMYKVIHGNWEDLPKIDWQDKEMESFTSTYLYLFQTLRQDAEDELKALEKITVDSNDKDSFTQLTNLIQMKRSQLGYEQVDPLIDHVAKTVSIPKKRRAS